jgi:hypothetical protein
MGITASESPSYRSLVSGRSEMTGPSTSGEQFQVVPDALLMGTDAFAPGVPAVD